MKSILTFFLGAVLTATALAQSKQMVRTEYAYDSVRASVHARIERDIKAADSLRLVLDQTDPSSIIDRNSIIHKLDSIKTRIVNYPGELVNKVRDSIAHRLEKNKYTRKANAVIQKVNTSSQTIGSTVNSKVDDVIGTVPVVQTEVAVPETGVSISELDADVPIPQTDISLPPTGLDVPEIKGPEIEVPELDTKLDIRDKLDLPSEKVAGAKNTLEQVDLKVKAAGKYEDDIKNISKEGVARAETAPEEIEKAVADREELKVLDKEAAKIKEYQSSIAKFKDPELMKQEVQRNAKLLASKELNKFSPAFKNAQQIVSKARRLNPVVKNFKELTKKRTNPMKGRPFKERFMPGIALQPVTGMKFMTDITAQASYRISGRLTGGAGYVYRISLSKENTNFVNDEGISGYRGFAQFTLRKSVFAHADFERFSMIKEKQLPVFENSPSTLYSANLGLGKRYSISKKWKGTFLALYHKNVVGQVPGINKFSVRMTFDLSLKKSRSLKLQLPDSAVEK